MLLGLWCWRRIEERSFYTTAARVLEESLEGLTLRDLAVILQQKRE